MISPDNINDINPNNSREGSYFIEGIRSNDRLIIQEIYAKHMAYVTKIILQNNGSHDDAKDVFQEVLISLHRQIHNGFQLKCDFDIFIYYSCKKRWLNHLNSKYISKTTSHSDITENIYSISENVNQFFKEDERMVLIHEKLKMLDKGCKELIELSWQSKDNGKNLNWQEIAERLDLAYGYVRRKSTECKERLISLVKKDIKYHELKN